MENEDDTPQDGAAFGVDASRKGKCAVIKTSTRQTIFLPVIGLVPVDKLKPGDLIGVNKDSFPYSIYCQPSMWAPLLYVVY